MDTENKQATEAIAEATDEDPMAKQPWYKSKRNIGIAAACVVVLVAACAGCAIAFNQPAPVQADNTEAAQEKAITLRVEAPDWAKDTSTPVIIHIQSSDGTVDFYRAIEANSDQKVYVAAGKDYTVTYISPVNADGSIYTTPAAQPISENKAETTLTKVPADQVTQEQANAILDQLKDAVSKGDETLSGDSGKDIVNNAAVNIGNAPNVNKDQIKDTVEKVEEAVTDTTQPSTPAEPSTPEQTTNDSTANTGTPNNTANTPVSTPGTPAEPQKVWVTDYQQQWVPNNVYVVDQAAYTEQVDTGEGYIQCSCGFTCNTNAEWTAHNKAQGWGNGHSYSVRPLYETVTHPEVGHYEDQGHYETVAAGGHWE